MYGFIEKRMEATHVTNQDLADKLNVNTSTISRFLSGKNELKFETLFEAIRFLFKEEEQPEICKFYFLHLRNKRNVKCALEYFSANHDMESLKHVIDREKPHATADLKELIFLYELKYKLVHCKEDLASVVENKNGNNATFRTKEAQAVLTVQKLIVGLVARKYQLIYDGKDIAFQKISELEDGFVKDSLMNTVHALLVTCYLYYNDIDAAKDSIFKAQKTFTTYYIEASTYYHLAKINFAHSYETALNNFIKALSICDAIGKKDLVMVIKERGIPFLHLYHNRPEKVNDIKNLVEHIQAYYCFRTGELTKAKAIVSKYEDVNCPYKYFIKGEVLDDSNSYWLSLLTFVNQGDILHLDLPIIALEKKGVSTNALNTLLTSRATINQTISTSSFL